MPKKDLLSSKSAGGEGLVTLLLMDDSFHLKSTGHALKSKS